GRELRAWLEKAEDDLRVRVDDAGARYPVTIDPYVQGVKLTQAIPCYDDQPCDEGRWGSASPARSCRTCRRVSSTCSSSRPTRSAGGCRINRCTTRRSSAPPT